MTISVQYSPTREDTYRWYLRLWKKGIWRVHVLMFFAPIGIVSLRLLAAHRPLAPDALLEAAGFGVAVVAVMWAYPLLLFKPAPRVLTLDASGITTTISQKGSTRRWAQIAAIHETDEGAVVMQLKAGNALIVPLRAFHSPKARTDFVEAAQGWISMANT
jgi:hypothetical protein